ncbi:EscU/YscU/HrcU family type III secretion system export apparatus switch protein [Stenotrophomonas maltophilia]
MSMKTEKPTPHRLLEESRKGKSYVSKDLTAAAVLLAGALALLTATPVQPLQAFFQGLVARGFAVGVAEAAQQVTVAFLWMAMPVALASILAAVGVSLLQSRGVIANKALRIDFAKLNPVAGFRNLFSLKVVKSSVAAMLYLLLGLAAAVVAWKLLAPLLFQQVQAPVSQAGAIWRETGWRGFAVFMALLAPVYLAVAVLDYRLYVRELRMDKSEIKQEYKDHNGNPEIKQRRRQLGEELSAQVQSDVVGSSMVLANPTHIAVGIYVHADYPTLQFVSVREKGARARAVIALAEKNGVPVVRDIPVARAVYVGVRRYQFVPPELTHPIARILHWLRDIERAHQPAAAAAGPSDAGTPTADGPATFE